MDILSGILKAVTPVIGKYAKDAVKTVFSENPARDAITDIANTVIDTACTLGVMALSQKETTGSSNTPCSPSSLISQEVYKPVQCQYSDMRKRLKTECYENNLIDI